MAAVRRARTKTHRQVRQEFIDAGVSIKDWATRQGVSHWLVYRVLNDERPATRGESHKIAVALGLKRAAVRVSA